MTILCANGTHVYLTGQPRCTCGQAANGYPQGSAMIYYPANYNPFGPRPPKPDPAPETSIEQLRAALRAGATCLSADGKFAYTERYGEVLQAEWDGAKYESWWPVVGGKMPENAVRL